MSNHQCFWLDTGDAYVATKEKEDGKMVWLKTDSPISKIRVAKTIKVTDGVVKIPER